MESDTIRLEGYAEQMKSRKIYCIGTPKNLPTLVRSRMVMLDGELAHRGRKCLILQDGSANSTWLLAMKWDAVFLVRDAGDLRLALTYVIHAPKPLRLVWSGGEPVFNVFQHLSKVEGVTMIGLGTANPTSQEWEAIFWSHDSVYDGIELVLQRRLGQALLEKYTLKSVLKEIQSSEVGLVWSAIGETDKRGSLYWFDPSEGGGGTTYSLKEAAEILHSIADAFSAN